MNNKIRNIVVTVVFLLFIFGFTVFAILKPPTAMSESERRPLAQFPANISLSTIINKTTINQFDKYAVDQFPLRDLFRSLKAHFQLDVLRIKENNGLAYEDGYIAAISNDFDFNNIKYSLSRLDYIDKKFLQDNVGDKYFVLVPDKNYYFAENYNYPAPDYNNLKMQISTILPDYKQIDIFDDLNLNSYYKTDTHWSQDKLLNAVDTLSENMGFEAPKDYTTNEKENFKGVYYLQSAMNPDAETLYYLTNSTIDAFTVYDYETDKTIEVYSDDLFTGKDSYNFFLGGTKALLRIDNSQATTDKELIIFRDSFGSSISPLIAQGYKSVYIVDTRYVMPDVISSYFTNNEADVLFMYSSLILNQNALR